MAEREQSGGAVGRVFWIQGRTGVYWQNLEHDEDGQRAIARLGELVGDGRYDELRLIQAEISPITGASDYLHIVTVRDGRVLAPNQDEFASRGPYAEAEAESAPEEMPQLLLWPEADDPDDPARQHALPLTDPAGANLSAPSAKPGPPTPGRGAERRLEDGSWDIGGWRISDEAHAALAAAREERAERDEGETATERASGGLAVEAEDAAVFGHRRAGGARASRPRRNDPNAAPRRAGGARRLIPESPGRRFALLSGVFAGAVALGLTLAASAPEKAAQLYAAAIMDVTRLAPQPSLEEAVAAGDLAAVSRRLSAGADPNGRDREGAPLLLRAARSGNLQTVTLLLQAGADPTLPGPDGRTVLHRAAAEGRALALARMLDAGAPVDLAGGVYGCLTPLALAAANGKPRAASLLAERGASLAPQPNCDAGPMEIAAGHPPVLARLEQIRAEREALLRLAAGPRPPLQAPTTTPTLTDAGEAPETPSAPVAAPLGQVAALSLQETVVDPPPIVGNDLLDEAIGAASDPAPSAPAARPPGQSGASQPAAPQSVAPQPAASQLAAPQVDAARDGRAPSMEDPDAPLETVEVAALEVKAAPPPAPPVMPRIKPDPPPASAAAPSAPPSQPVTPDTLAARIATAIDRGEAGEVARLADQLGRTQLAALTTVADDRYGAGERALVDHAVLRGRRRIADMLIERGLAPTPVALHAAVANADRPELAGTAAWLVERGVDVNARHEGLTPLMRAALRGRADLAETLLAAGADPGAATEDGRVASDFARRAGRPALQETLLLAAQEERYRALMLGFSWTDTLASLDQRTEVCKDIGDDFTACKLQTDPWLDDAAVVVGQFDRRAGDRLVALQIDSRPFTDPTAAKRRFEEVASAIESRLPSDHGGFTNRRAPDGGSFFRALRPEINQGAYFGYWPDHDRARPVFVHLKLAGIDDARGFYRIVIGNPFRAS
ncbi:MAG: ankyrin repeat domain-containing protein [Marivibrio sp.]|uniref:ankyrin repeat domain-containing protein n=1 Tax=Marivibrio sp. TaxID=2039719 RepID=UPI0032F08AD5